MADFNSHIITNAGRNLLARALAGQGKVLFTKAAFGDQKHSGNLREVTELKNKKLDLNVMNIRNDNGTAVLTVQISNENVEQSFQTEEFGVYAKIEGDRTEILYSYTTAVSADTFPNNRLGKTYESIQDIYMAISSDVEAEIYVRDGVIYLTRDIANQVYTETGLIAVGTLKGRNNLEADKQYLADNGHWYKNIGGDRTWNSSGTADEQLIPVTWEYLYKNFNNKNEDVKNKLKLKAENNLSNVENSIIISKVGNGDLDNPNGNLIIDRNVKEKLNGLNTKIDSVLGQNNGQFPVENPVIGNVYYFQGNQKYYICKATENRRVTVPNANFEELSIFENRKRLENLFKYSKIFEGRAATKGQVLGTIPDNSKFIEIIGINYASDGNFYYFQPIILRTDIVKNRDIFFNIGITSDIREIGLSFKNNIISIIHSSYSNSTADNNVIGQILSVNA